MGFQPNTSYPTRYARTFNWLDPNAFVSPYFFMTASTTGVAGDLVEYNTAVEVDTIKIATSGALRSAIAGFLTQDVKDLDGGAVRGWRNLNNSVANLSDNVGVLQSNGLIETTRVEGTLSRGNTVQASANSNGRLQAVDSLTAGTVLGVVEAASVRASSNEPAQGSATADSLVRIRIYGL